jgi:aryl-alcohol dehydrogenase-like predicted oxidoreductase/predicted kinase
MRLSTDEERDEDRAIRTIVAAAAAGVTVFDTARAYGRDGSEMGHNERLLARALRRCGAAATARIVTKGGMSRVANPRVGTQAASGWIPDGRAKAIRGDCEASRAALDGLPIDLYLLHAPDPRTPWATSIRALARLLDEGLVRRIGLSNVNRRQLDEALELAPVTAVEVALSVHDDRALRGGILERCEELGIALIAHSPLGGPRRAGTLGRVETLRNIADAGVATPAELALAWLLELSPVIVAIPGARRPESASSAARAARLELDRGERDALRRAFGGAREARDARGARPRAGEGSEVLVVMGIPGAGKSRLAEEYVARGYVRLNRDERGASLRELAARLEEELSSGRPAVVLDNTYLTRASRSYVIETAERHGVAVRCVWLDTPLAQAQVNLVERLLDRVDALPAPEELRSLARREPGALAPTSQMRALRELEPPSSDEGFTSVETVPFVREPGPDDARPGVFVVAGALRVDGWEAALAGEQPEAPHLLYDWQPDGSLDALEAPAERLRSIVSGVVHTALCPHGGGPPVCWCRPPLPGLPLAFARAQRVDPARSILVGTGAAHRTLARTLGARYVGV